ncbi:STAS domain-containing protein [Planctomicrobium sp. SH661]|uniref:STAS domain-containing protein n=1 Tax=Planctomicrobium sp. SH661 TaxID=3448124 RepID=UPI003F5BC7F2
MATENLVKTDRQDDVTVVSFGPSAASIQGSLPDDMTPALLAAAEPSLHLLIDLQGVEFFNSSFIELLVRCWNCVKEQPGGRFGLCNVHPYCRDVLEITNLTQVWKIYPSRDAGVMDLRTEKRS